jgi:sugar/nucleoside kinase (ribokinase family)
VLDLIAVGDVMLDVFAPPVAPGERRHEPVRVRAGGSAVNAALAAAADGARAAAAGRIGADAGGAAILDTLRRHGVESLLAVDPARPTGAVVHAGTGIVADRGANAALTADDLPARLDARAVLVSGYIVFRDDTAAAGRAALDRTAALTCVDLQIATTRAQLPRADVLVGNEDAIDTLGGVDALAPHFRVVCQTLGARGAVAASGDERASTGVPHVVAGVTVGAGDAFAARFVLALADGRPLADALARATGIFTSRPE